MVSKHTYFYVLFSRSADFQKTVQKLDFRWVRNNSPPPWLGGRWQAVGREGGGGGGGGGWWCAGGVLVVCWWCAGGVGLKNLVSIFRFSKYN